VIYQPPQHPYVCFCGWHPTIGHIEQLSRQRENRQILWELVQRDRITQARRLTLPAKKVTL